MVIVVGEPGGAGKRQEAVAGELKDSNSHQAGLCGTGSTDKIGRW